MARKQAEIQAEVAKTKNLAREVVGVVCAVIDYARASHAAKADAEKAIVEQTDNFIAALAKFDEEES